MFIVLFLLSLPILQASLLSVETLSPSSANLCGIYPQNVTIAAQNIQNAGNQTIENVTAILVSEPNNGGINIIEPSLYLGSITPGILSVNPSWQVQCADPGVYTVHVDFSNAEGNLGSSQGQAVSAITAYANDNTPPLIESYAPTGVIPTSYITLEVVTDEDATCKYSIIPGVAYADQQGSFQITGGKSHKAPLQNLVDSLYHFYIRCKDAAGNGDQSDYVATVEINAPPTAILSLSKLSPLSKGTTEISVTTSEPVKPVPSLSYSCGENSVGVPLAGSGTEWKGYLVIGQENVNEVCSFSFSSTDLSGNDGSYITGGNVFLIDTLPPPAPTQLTAAEQKGPAVKLNWRFSTEAVQSFNVYRLSDSNNDFSQYQSAAQNSFIDTAVSLGKTYRYKVTAVDEAGNEGPLSEEASVSIEGITLSGTDKNLPDGAEESALATKKAAITLSEIDSMIKVADYLLDSFNALRTQLKEENGKFSLLGIFNRIKDAKVMLLQKKEELGMLKNSDLTDTKTADDFQVIKDKIKSINNTIITEIHPDQPHYFDLKATPEQLSSVINNYLEKKKPFLKDAEKEKYLLSAKNLQSTAAVKVKVQEIEVEYLNATKEKMLWVEKKVIPGPSLTTVYILESVPKELASSADEMILGEKAEVIERDPLVFYTLNQDNNFTYSYLLRKNYDQAKVTETVTALIPTLSTSEEVAGASLDDGGTNFLTGNAIATVKSWANAISIYDAGIAIGIALIVILFIYSSIYSEREVTIQLQNDFPSFAFPTYLKKLFLRRKNRNTERGEIIFPDHVGEGYQKSGLTALMDSSFFILLKNIDDSLNSLNFEKAVKFYHLFSIQGDSALYKKEKMKLGETSERVKKKMALLTKHTLLEYCVKKNEHKHLHQALNEIADLYNELLPEASEKEKIFFQQMKEGHHRYSQQLLYRK